MAYQFHQVVVGSVLSGPVCHITGERNVEADMLRYIDDTADSTIVVLACDIFLVQPLRHGPVQEKGKQKQDKIKYGLGIGTVLKVE